MAPKKRSGSGASKQSKKKKPTARAADSSDDGDDMEEEPDGPSHEGKVTFGAQFMLFRVLMLGGVSVSFARSAGNVAKILSAAARQGATWARCGTDGRAGQLHSHHRADSRVHRCMREVGFLRANQSEIDADPRSRQVYAEFRHEVNQISRVRVRVRVLRVKKNVIRDTEPKFKEPKFTQKTTKNKLSHVHQACRGDALIGDLHRGVKVDIFRGL